MKKVTQALPWILVALCAAWVISTLRPAPEPAFHAGEFGRIPALADGRVQPLDSVARNSLLQMRNRQTVLVDRRKSMPAIDWLMEMLMKPGQANTRKVFRIDNPEVLSLLKLPPADKYFSFAQIQPSLPELEKQSERINAIEEKQRTTFERQLAKLYSAIFLYHRLQNSLQPEDTRNFPADLQTYQRIVAPGMAAVQAQTERKSYDQKLFDQVMPYLKNFEFVSRAAYPLLLPPLQPKAVRDDWKNTGTSLLDLAAGKTRDLHPALIQYAAMSSAYAQGKPDEFNRVVAQYRQWLASKQLTPELTRTRWESFFNHSEPFYKSTVIYVLAFLLACISWINQSGWTRRAGYYLALLAFVIHTAGMLFRMALEGRPPVTNLYSSAVFVGWGAVLLGLILERIYRDGIGTVTAAGIGVITQIIAHNLAVGGDTMQMMRAVLDSNFWLSTHVITIAIGYSSCFVAGFLAIIYILRGVFTSSLAEPTAKALHRMVYGIICFATLFSFVGTVLGGIWADQSWGRFWGWDPKENGALLIVLWTAAYLHVRWGGLLKERGLMNMAVFGNVVTAFSWFGVNLLGVGLHAYGFTDSGFKWLMLFIASQLAVIGFGLLPKEMWRSFRPPAPEPGSSAEALVGQSVAGK